MSSDSFYLASGIKLIGGPSERIGTIQLCHERGLGTVCDDNFDDNDATVVCRMLGFTYVEQDFYQNQRRMKQRLMV